MKIFKDLELQTSELSHLFKLVQCPSLYGNNRDGYSVYTKGHLSTPPPDLYTDHAGPEIRVDLCVTLRT